MDNHFTPEVIKQLRKSLKLTQSQFAKRLKVEVVTVSRYECGRSRPALAVRRRLSRESKKVEQ